MEYIQYIFCNIFTCFKIIQAPFFFSRPDLSEVLAVLLITHFVCSFKFALASCYKFGLF